MWRRYTRENCLRNTVIDYNFAMVEGIVKGNLGQIAEAHFPNGQVNYYNSHTDTMTALRTGKVDAMVGDEAVIR